MKNVAVIPIILFAVISFSFSTSCSDVLASSEFLQDTDAVYITINQVVDPGEPQVSGVNLFDASSTGEDDDPVAINLENPAHGVSRITMEVCDEGDYLSLVRCEVTERTEGFLCRAFDGTDGCCSVMLFSMTGSSVIEQGSGPIFTLQYAVSDQAPIDECRVLTTENVDAMDPSGASLQVISSQGEYCFAAEGEPEDPDGDPDGDGFIGDLDQCPDFDPTSDPNHGMDIIIDGCNTGAPNISAKGCLLSDLIDQCEEKAEKTIFVLGRFVSCVAHLTNECKKEGLIEKNEKGGIQRCAVRANLPWIRLNWD